MDSNKNDKLKKLLKTIDTIVKARQIQKLIDKKAKVDLNVMKEELKKFQKPMVDQLISIVDVSNTKKKKFTSR